MLTVMETVPDALLTADATQLDDILGGPTLIHLPGRREPLLVTVLLHGNETTGWEAVRRVLNRYRSMELPRALSLFIGNVKAARFGLRRLDMQPDYNRIWTGTGTPEHAMMQQVIVEMRQRQVFASIDIHNNTGVNPHYACVNRLEQRFLQFASLFSHTIVYFLRPEGVQSAAFARICPATTVECGQPNQVAGVDHAEQFIEAGLNLDHIPDQPIAHGDLDLFHTVAVVKVPAEVDFGFGDSEAAIRFPRDLERMNFSELPAQTVIGWLTRDDDIRLDVTDEQGEPTGERYFSYENNEIRLKTPVMPSMLTCNERIIRQDCLCYLMERLAVGQ